MVHNRRLVLECQVWRHWGWLENICLRVIGYMQDFLLGFASILSLVLLVLRPSCTIHPCSFHNLSDFVQSEDGLGGNRVAAPVNERNALGFNVILRSRF